MDFLLGIQSHFRLGVLENNLLNNLLEVQKIFIPMQGEKLSIHSIQVCKNGYRIIAQSRVTIKGMTSCILCKMRSPSSTSIPDETSKLWQPPNRYRLIIESNRTGKNNQTPNHGKLLQQIKHHLDEMTHSIGRQFQKNVWNIFLSISN